MHRDSENLRYDHECSARIWQAAGVWSHGSGGDSGLHMPRHRLMVRLHFPHAVCRCTHFRVDSSTSVRFSFCGTREKHLDNQRLSQASLTSVSLHALLQLLGQPPSGLQPPHFNSERCKRWLKLHLSSQSPSILLAPLCARSPFRESTYLPLHRRLIIASRRPSMMPFCSHSI